VDELFGVLVLSGPDYDRTDYDVMMTLFDDVISHDISTSDCINNLSPI